MADVRSLLRNERTARRITHPHATYSTTGTLVCLVCHIQLKSESLWDGHLKSSQHAMRLQRIRDGTLGRPPGAPAPEPQQEDEEERDTSEGNKLTEVTNGSTEDVAVAKSKKRKADEDEDEEEVVTKKVKSRALPEGFFDGGAPEDVQGEKAANTTPPTPGQDFKLPSRPATPLKAPEIQIVAKQAQVDENEWAAFEADIAASEVPTAEGAVISVPAISAAELAARSREEENAHRKEKQEAETEGDKEDAVRKLEEEFEEMEALEERIRRLKEKREALRLKESETKAVVTESDIVPPAATAINGDAEDEDDEDDENDDDDDWDGFRLKR